MHCRGEEEMKTRADEILKETRQRGVFDLKSEELEFGAKLAWRNSPRCPGRIQWRNLKLFDCRFAKTRQKAFSYLRLKKLNGFL